MTDFSDVYRGVSNRNLWTQVQRENGDATDDEAWESYLRFIRTIFGVNADAYLSSQESSNT